LNYRDPSTGKRRQQWHTIKGTKRDAEQELANMLHSLKAGSYVKPNRITVGEYLKQWSENYAVLHTSPRTCESYKAEVQNHIIPALGAIPLCQLQPEQVENYYANALTKGRTDGKGGLSVRTVLYHHRILSESLDHAVKIGLISRNPTKSIDMPKLDNRI
jgi:site-specific recombinase XerC